MKAVEILQPAAREADATAKTRQNLALAFALSGRWQEAKSVAAIDVPADQLDQRVMQWAAFSRPTNAYDQVASLLGVRAVADNGQPAQLALVQPAENVGVAAVEAPVAAPLDAYMPSAPDSTAVASDTQVAATEPRAAVEPEPTQVAGTGPQVVFGPREEIVQQIPVQAAHAQPVRAVASRPQSTAATTPVSFAKGNFYVQLGAYVSPAVAHDAWRRSAQRVPALSQHSPQGARVTTKAGNFYRLSVGGFTRNDADSLCRTVKSNGGACFVRTQAGDSLASWARGGAQVASR